MGHFGPSLTAPLGLCEAFERHTDCEVCGDGMAVPSRAGSFLANTQAHLETLHGLGLALLGRGSSRRTSLPLPSGR